MSYRGKYPIDRKDGDILADANGGPPWARIGALVAKSAGWTAMQVMKVDKSYATNPILTLAYGPDDAKYGVTEERACNTLRPFCKNKIVSGHKPRCFWPGAIQDNATGLWWAGPFFIPNTYETETYDMALKAKRNDLFQWTQDGKKAFGIFLTEDADGQWVMQIVDGDKAVVVVDPDVCEKVMPYTIEVRHLNGNGTSHWKARKGQVKDNDLILTSEGNMVQVVRVDTKHESASKKLDGRIVATKPLGKGVEDQAAQSMATLDVGSEG